jgi:hypothetical protein
MSMVTSCRTPVNLNGLAGRRLLYAVEPTKIWKVDPWRMKVAATIEPGGDVRASNLLERSAVDAG